MFHLVESDIDVLDVMHNFVLHNGFQSLPFDSPISYLKYMESPEYSPPTAVITSYRLQYTSGYDFITAIREVIPNQKTVIISAFSVGDIAPEINQSVCFSLGKPFRIDQFSSLLKTLHRCESEKEAIDTSEFEGICGMGKNVYCHLHSCRAGY